MPENSIQHILGTAVDLGEIQSSRNLRMLPQQRIVNRLRCRIHLIERHSDRYRLERCQIRLVDKTVKHRRGTRIKLVHRLHSQDLLDGPQHTGRVVIGADRRAPLRVGTRNVGCRSVSRNVIPARLRVILDSKDRHLRPELGVTEGLHNPPEGEIIIGDTSRGRGAVRRSAAGVVIRQADDDQLGQRSLSLELPQLINDEIRPILVRDTHFPADILGR